MEQYEFVENKDFKIVNVNYLGNNGKTYHKIDYLLHPRAFKLCLMRSKNTKQYSYYYLLLEESIKYYHDYQLLFKDKLLKQKDDKIDGLNKKIDEMMIELKDVKIELSKVNITLNKINDKLDKCAAHIPDDVNLEDRFVLLRKENEYYVIRRQKKSLTTAIKQKEKDGYELLPIINYQTIPNSITFWNAIRDVLLKDNQIVCKRNTFMLTEKLSEEDFYTIIKEVFNQRINFN